MTSDLVPFDQLTTMAAVLGKKKLFGMDADELLPLMLIAQAEGRHPASASQEYDIIQGKPALRSRAALARFQQCGGSIQWKERTAEKATAIFSHPQGGTLAVSWSMERAKRAGLGTKDNWQKYPEAMLSARVIAEGVRAIFPGCLSGMYLGEEVQDFGPSSGYRDVTPAPEEISAPVAPVAPIDPEQIAALRGRLNEILGDPLLPKAGREKIVAALARAEATAEELVDLVDRAETAIDKARGAA